MPSEPGTSSAESRDRGAVGGHPPTAPDQSASRLASVPAGVADRAGEHGRQQVDGEAAGAAAARAAVAAAVRRGGGGGRGGSGRFGGGVGDGLVRVPGRRER